MVEPSGAVHGAAGRAPPVGHAVCRVALPFELLVPRRSVAAGGVGRRGHAARARGAGRHRSRRVLRRGPLRRSGAGARVCRRSSGPSSVCDRQESQSSNRGPGRPSSPPPIRTPTTCWSSPAVRRATHRWPAPSVRPTWPAARRAIPRTRRRACASWPRATGWCSRVAGSRRCPPRCVNHGPAAAARELSDLVACFGRDNVVVELWDHGDPLDSARNDALVNLATRQGLGSRRHQQRALRHAGAPTARHRARRGAGAAQS